MELIVLGELSVLGVFAGIITTVAGMGGGMLLLLTLAALHDPRYALAATAPALLVGNAHRFLLFRRHIDPRAAFSLAAGAFPGSALGGLLAVAVPRDVLHWLMLITAALAIWRAIGGAKIALPARWLSLVGFITGVLCATSGGAGFLIAPALLATGMVGETFLATAACGAVAMHLGRILGYGAGGMMTDEVWMHAVVLAIAITAGNMLGRRVRDALAGRLDGKLEYAALTACLVLAIAGM